MSKGDFAQRWTLAQHKRISHDLANGKLPRDAHTYEESDGTFVDLRGVKVSSSIHVRKMDRWDLSYADLGAGWMSTSRQTARGSRFSYCTLDGNIRDDFSECDFRHVRFQATMSGAFTRCDFGGAFLKRLDSFRLRFVDCDFTEAHFRHCNLNNTVFENCTWSNARFSGGSANGTQWVGTRPTDQQLAAVWIMSEEESDSEREALEEVRKEIKRQRNIKRKPT